MSKLILSVNPNYTVDFVKGLVEKAIAEMRLTEYIESIESREDTGSFVKIGRPIDMIELKKLEEKKCLTDYLVWENTGEPESTHYKCKNCGTFNSLKETHYLHKGSHFCNEECAKAYWDYVTEGEFGEFEENDDNAEKGQANDET